MGMSFDSLQVLTGECRTLKQVKEKLFKYFETKEMIPADADTAHVSYLLALSENGKWLSVYRKEYESNRQIIRKDSQILAEVFDTGCIETVVMDSDAIGLNLVDQRAEVIDFIANGVDSYGGKDRQGEREIWEPLLEEGVTWEQFQETLSGKYIGEDILWEMAPLFGMDQKIFASDYDAVDSMEHDNPNIEMLYLKSTKPRPKGLGTVFKQVFKEALEPLGFVKIKGRQPYFVRLIGDEIIHVITYLEESTGEPGRKAFDILGGVATVYRGCIDLTKTPFMNSRWLGGNLDFYRKKNSQATKAEHLAMFDELYRFYYKEDYNNEEIFAIVRHALEVTQEHMLPVLDEVCDLEACIEYFDVYQGRLLNLYEDFGIKYGGALESEGLLLIKTNKRSEIFEEARKSRTESQLEAEFPGWAPHYRMLEDPKVTLELERRKAANTETLRSYGLDI